MSIDLGKEAEGLRSRIDAGETLSGGEYQKLAQFYLARHAWVDDNGWLLARANAFGAELYKGNQPEMDQHGFNLKMQGYFQTVPGTSHLPSGAAERVEKVVEGYLRGYAAAIEVEVEEYRRNGRPQHHIINEH